jgi:hypothetical protein
MQRVCFVVGERPHCIWLADPIGRNVEFLRSLDSGYFEYLARLHSEQLAGDSRMAAAIALRLAYSQAMETLFALLCATVQSPMCVFGWLGRYSNGELRATVEKISRGDDLMTVVRERPVTWESLSQRVHAGVIAGDEEKQSWLVAGYECAWARLASDFLDAKVRDEYNCIKHGSRAIPGGFSFKFGEWAPAGSEYGSRFFAVEEVEKGSHNFFVHLNGLNWSPVKLAERLHLISASISNVVNWLLLLFGQPITPGVFRYPDDPQGFQSPWDDGIQATTMDFRYGFVKSSIRLLSRDEILGEYREYSMQYRPEPGGDAASGPPVARPSD